MVQIKKAHAKHLEKDNIGKERGPTSSLDGFEFLFSDSVREASNDVNTFLNLRFIKKETSCFFVFFEKVLYANKFKIKKASLNVPVLL